MTDPAEVDLIHNHVVEFVTAKPAAFKTVMTEQLYTYSVDWGKYDAEILKAWTQLTEPLAIAWKSRPVVQELPPRRESKYPIRFWYGE